MLTLGLSKISKRKRSSLRPPSSQRSEKKQLKSPQVQIQEEKVNKTINIYEDLESAINQFEYPELDYPPIQFDEESPSSSEAWNKIAQGILYPQKNGYYYTNYAKKVQDLQLKKILKLIRAKNIGKQKQPKKHSFASNRKGSTPKSRRAAKFIKRESVFEKLYKLSASPTPEQLKNSSPPELSENRLKKKFRQIKKVEIWENDREDGKLPKLKIINLEISEDEDEDQESEKNITKMTSVNERYSRNSIESSLRNKTLPIVKNQDENSCLCLIRKNGTFTKHLPIKPVPLEVDRERISVIQSNNKIEQIIDNKRKSCSQSPINIKKNIAQSKTSLYTKIRPLLSNKIKPLQLIQPSPSVVDTTNRSEKKQINLEEQVKKELTRDMTDLSSDVRLFPLNRPTSTNMLRNRSIKRIKSKEQCPKRDLSENKKNNDTLSFLYKNDCTLKNNKNLSTQRRKTPSPFTSRRKKLKERNITPTILPSEAREVNKIDQDPVTISLLGRSKKFVETPTSKKIKLFLTTKNHSVKNRIRNEGTPNNLIKQYKYYSILHAFCESPTSLIHQYPALNHDQYI